MFVQKKFKIWSIVGLVALVCLSGALYAKSDRYGAAGCGIGSLLFGGDNSTSSQIFAMTTNQSSSQTSSITSGTSNCYADEVSWLKLRQQEFAALHYQDLRQEMAAGSGEKLEHFAVIMGCSAAVPAFKSMAQSKHQHIFDAKFDAAFASSVEKGSRAFIQVIQSNIDGDLLLKKHCRLI